MEVPRPTRFPTREVRIGPLTVGGQHPILIQSMTIADTCDTEAVVREIRRLTEVGCPLVRVTAPSIKDAENLREIRRLLDEADVRVPLVADIHFTPNAALVAAEIVDKVRINPGNYADRKKFQVFEISDKEYRAELDRIRDRFLPLVHKLKERDVALRIGTNHGSLSDRIMNRYGDTPEGMVESALEFVRICRDEDYHQIVLSMKSSIPSVMIAAYRLLAHRMTEEGMNYPLHLGVTEAGNGLEGRIKSAIGIGSLLASGLGDTIRVSLTEDSEHEIPACSAILEASRDEIPHSRARARPGSATAFPTDGPTRTDGAEPASEYWRTLPLATAPTRRTTASWDLRGAPLGGTHPIRVELRVTLAVASPLDSLTRSRLSRAGRDRGPELVSIRFDEAATTSVEDRTKKVRELRALCPATPLLLESSFDTWIPAGGTHPVLTPDVAALLELVDGLSVAVPLAGTGSALPRADVTDWDRKRATALVRLPGRGTGPALAAPPALAPSTAQRTHALLEIARAEEAPQPPDSLRTRLAIARAWRLAAALADRPDLIFLEAPCEGPEAPMLAGALLCDGIVVTDSPDGVDRARIPWPPGGVAWTEEPLASTYAILQACRVRLTRAEFIACPSCGRTQFNLQSTTARIRERTSHLRGVKIAIMAASSTARARWRTRISGTWKWTGKGRPLCRKRAGRAGGPRGRGSGPAHSPAPTHGAWVEPPTRTPFLRLETAAQDALCPRKQNRASRPP
ncbi:MAG: (E)-4-hydroxy-3-methylbut-2-enyl-diphosphate synthase [Candidatus Eisenbacteria bacterium]